MHYDLDVISFKQMQQTVYHVLCKASVRVPYKKLIYYAYYFRV